MSIRALLPYAGAALLFVSATASAQVTAGCPAAIDSTQLTQTEITDFTEHTYAVRAGAPGTFADCSVTRKFSGAISELKLFIVDGQADDVGYVGAIEVASSLPGCNAIGVVSGEIDVTTQVTINGDTASFLLRAQEDCCCWTGWGSATEAGRRNARFRWEVTLGDDREIRVALGSDASSGETTSASGNIRPAHIPLGSDFSVQLLKKDDNDQMVPVQATFSVESHTIAPALPGRSVFPSHVVFAYGSGAATTRSFQSVHLGTASIRITPADPEEQPVSVPVIIESPAALGSTRNEFDAPLTAVAHDAGVPPQVLKGQVRQESSFRETAYRYEPLSIDFDLFSPHGRNWRTIAPYRNFRLATSDGLAQGAELIEEDISPRSRYFIVRNGQRRRIQAGDTLVSTREIYDENDAQSGWARFSSQARLRRIEADPSLLDFTAQTPVAASYGWFQVLYTTAIDSQWQGINGRLNPSYLFDTVDNLNAGGGSIRVAMVRLRTGFNATNGGQSANPSFARRQQFDGAWQRALNHYNHSTPGELQQHPYGVRILQFAENDYAPRPAGAIFR